jgi:hypothetical protein
VLGRLFCGQLTNGYCRVVRPDIILKNIQKIEKNQKGFMLQTIVLIFAFYNFVVCFQDIFHFAHINSLIITAVQKIYMGSKHIQITAIYFVPFIYKK